MPIRKISQAEAAENKKKQQVLRTAGYNIKVDGSWGPWQEKQYRKVTSAKRGKTSQANVGVMALPVAGYGIAQLLEGLGSISLPSISLPSISAPAAAMAAPVALTLAGPAYGLYETITGQHHQVNITPQERQAMTYAPDATRVSRPIVVSRTRVGSQSQSRPIGEMYINPALTRTRSVSMASEAARDSIQPTSRDSIEQTSGTTPQGEQPEEKKNWRDKIADKVGRIIRGKKSQEQKPNNPERPKSSKPLRKTAWNVYKWSWYVPTAIDVVGNVAGATKNLDTYSPSLKALEYRTRPIRTLYNVLGEFYNPQSPTADSTAVTPPNNPDNQPKANQDTVVVYPLTEEDKKGYEKDSANYAKKLIDAKRAAAIELAKDTL